MGALEERITLTAKMFANIKDKDGSEQSKVNNNIHIVFEEECEPRTDGETIYLPTNMNEEKLWELLGTLLHESFHIRFTDMKSINKDFYNDKGLFYCLNTLEDMRINSKAMELFPKTKLFFHSLYYFLAKNRKDDFLKEPLCFQIIKTLLLTSDDFPVFSEKANELIKLHNLEKYIDIAKKASNVSSLQTPARALYAKLKEISGDELSKLNDSDLSNFMNEVKKDLEEKLNKQNEKYKDVKNKYEDVRELIDKLRAEYKRLHRIQATNSTRSRNLNLEADDLDKQADEAYKNGDMSASNELRNKANHKRKLSDAAKSRAEKASIELAEIEQKLMEANKKYSDLAKRVSLEAGELETASKMLEDLLKKGTSSTAAGFGYSPLPMNGVEALSKNDLCYKHDYFLPKTLDDIIREVFLRKREEKEIDDEGSRMNRKNLYRIVTDCQRIFDSPIEPFDKTKISFLLDMSGSMGGRREKLVNTSFACLYNSLMEVLVAEQLEVEVGVFGFDTDLFTLKDFNEEKNGEEVLKEYYPRGGTDILENLEKVIKKMEESGQNEKKVIILLTDADVYEDELRQIKNSINFEDCKVIFIGIECRNSGNQSYTEILKELFIDNIEKESDVIDILTNALVRSI